VFLRRHYDVSSYIALVTHPMSAQQHQCICPRIVALLLAITIRLYCDVVGHDSTISLNSSIDYDARSICAIRHTLISDLQRFGLPDVVAVNWGQWHGPYSLPPERLVICADGRGFLWKQIELESRLVVFMRKLMPLQIAQLFNLILREWPQGSVERKGEDGKFLWLLDVDYNFIVAPVMQARGFDGAIQEVKHGDLSPGITFFGNNAAAGPYRGVARFGGEFNLAGVRDGAEWIMHAKSGYTAYRVPVKKANDYHHAMQEAAKEETQIARNFQRCVLRDIFRGRAPLTRLLCYLRRQLRVQAIPGVTQQCDIRTKLVDGLPNLAECAPKDSGEDEVCVEEFGVLVGSPIVHLVDWYAVGQDRCNHTISEYSSLLRNVDDNIKTFGAFLPVVAVSSGGRAYARSISKKLGSLRKDACLLSEEFTRQLTNCNVHGCFGEGFTQELKKVESLFGGVLLDFQELELLWQKAMKIWAQCSLATTGDEL